MKKQQKNFLGIFLVSCSFGLLLLHSRSNTSIHAVQYIATMLFAWGFYTYAIFTKSSFSIKQIFFAAVFFRLLALFTNPLMEDDYFRYLWNGYQFVEIGQIRTIPPIDFFTANVPENMSHVLSGINNPHLPSIYSPLTEYVFALAYLIAPAKLLIVKLIYLLIEGLTFWSVYKLFNSKQLLLILWNPLLIFETYVNAHPDIIAMCFLLLAWASFKKSNYLLLGAFLGLAFSSRLFLIITIPLILISHKSILGFIFSSSLCYTPFLLMEKSFGSIGTFINKWEFNSSLFGVLRSLTTFEIAQFICATGIILFLAGFWWRFYKKTSLFSHEITPDIQLNFGVLFLLFFLLSAVFNPWYCIVCIPFLAINKKYTLLLISWALSLSYIHGLNIPSPDMQAYDIPSAILFIEYFIIFICLFIDIKNRHGSFQALFKKISKPILDKQCLNIMAQKRKLDD